MQKKPQSWQLGIFLHKLTHNLLAEPAIFYKKNDFFVKGWDKTQKSLPLRR